MTSYTIVFIKVSVVVVCEEQKMATNTECNGKDPRITEALELIHTALDRISQLIDPNFESHRSAEEIQEDLDEVISSLAELI